MSDPTPNEIMTVVAARLLDNSSVCFVGIGLPSAAANLARATHAPEIVLIYESGTIGTKPDVLPLSIGDGELAETADTTVSVPEIFRYWLQGGRVTVGFLGLEAMDRRRRGGLTDDEGRKKELEDEIKTWLPAGSDVALSKIPKWDDTESALAAEFKVSGSLATSAGKRWLLPAHVFQVNEKTKFPSAERVNAVYFYYPYREIDEVHVTLPTGAEVESLPADDDVKTDFAVYSTKQKVETPGTVFSRRDLIMGGMAFPNKVYKEVKDFYDKVKVGDDQPALLKAPTHAASN